MNINKIKINGFGKINNKEITLNKGINVIIGNNETGKSTISKFIPSIFYGLSKNKNGKEISDFDKFNPWTKGEFSGKIEYEMDNNESYEVYRDFSKKNPVIYNSIKEDISKKFKIDKTKGIDFFKEQSGIDEETFLSTAIIEQESVKLERANQNSIVQKISNKIDSGDDNISYKKTLDRINKRQLEEIGTERTLQKPINIVNNKILNLIEKKEQLEAYKEKNANNFYELEETKYEELGEEKKIEFLKDLKTKLEKNKVKDAEISFCKNLELEYRRKIDSLKNSLENVNQNRSYISVYVYLIIMILLISILVSLIIIRPQLYNYILLIPIIFCFIMFIYSLHKNKKDKSIDINKIENEIELLVTSLDNQQMETKLKEENLQLENEKENTLLIERYVDDIDRSFIENCINKSYDEIQKEIDIVERNRSLLNIKISTLEIENNEISNKLEDFILIEEALNRAKTEKETLDKLNNSYNIAKECLEKAYLQVKQNISPRFTQNLKYIVSKISDGKYTNANINDEDGLEVEIENGSYVPVSRLSTGTIDQMYLSLRLSALNEISDETIPIIFDETFAYFDDERLENILKFMKNNFNNQIIIFSCSKREINCLNRIHAEYNLINLEK